MILLSVCKSERSLRRQVDTLAMLKWNAAAELHQSATSLSPVKASVIVRCPLILVHFDKRFSTSGGLQRSRTKGDSGSRRLDTGDGTSGYGRNGGTVVCPSCGHPCARTEVFMCTFSFTYRRRFIYCRNWC